MFTTAFVAVAALGERTGYGHRRAQALAGARGTLLIVGLGPGYDLSHLPPDVTDVIAIEPDAAMRRHAQRRIRKAPVRTTLVAGLAEALPLADGSVDSALVALVLCSVSDAAMAAAELKRVLGPDGSLHVLEHVRASSHGRLEHWQHRLNPLWGRLAAGCSLTCDTRQVLADAGFDTSGLVDFTVPLAPPVVSPQLAGMARLRAP